MRAVEPQEPPVINIRGRRVALGPIRRDLVPQYRKWINDFETSASSGNTPGPLTEGQEEEWYSQIGKDRHKVSFTIYELSEMTPVGTTMLREIDYRHRTAIFGIDIAETSYRGRGLGTKTTGLMRDYATTVLGLHSVTLTVSAFNEAGRRACEKEGLREFGRQREAYYMGGRLWDVIHMECLATEFESPVLRARLDGAAGT